MLLVVQTLQGTSKFGALVSKLLLFQLFLAQTLGIEAAWYRHIAESYQFMLMLRFACKFIQCVNGLAIQRHFVS